MKNTSKRTREKFNYLNNKPTTIYTFVLFFISSSAFEKVKISNQDLQGADCETVTKKQLQSTLVISKSKGLSEILPDIRTSTLSEVQN